jgi:hypothetical protein
MNSIEIALQNAKELFPICIPSYKRWEKKENKTLTNIISNCDEQIRNNTYVFVRKEQAENYKENFIELGINIVELPIVDGLSDTRQYMCDYVTDILNEDYFIDLDDDLIDLKFVYKDTDGKVKLNTKQPEKYSKIIRLFCEISKVAFEKDNCLLGSLHRVRFANNKDTYNNAYTTNKGATPRQCMSINARLLKNKNIKRNAMFNPTGDDMGFVAEIAKNRGNMFNVNCLAYSFIDDAVNSVIRNDSNRKQLASYEYECLKQYPIKHYLRIPFTYEDGSYKFSDIDFTKYRKIYNKKSIKLDLEVLCKIKNWT